MELQIQYWLTRIHEPHWAKLSKLGPRPVIRAAHYQESLVIDPFVQFIMSKAFSTPFICWLKPAFLVLKRQKWSLSASEEVWGAGVVLHWAPWMPWRVVRTPWILPNPRLTYTVAWPAWTFESGFMGGEYIPGFIALVLIFFTVWLCISKDFSGDRVDEVQLGSIVSLYWETKKMRSDRSDFPLGTDNP